MIEAEDHYAGPATLIQGESETAIYSEYVVMVEGPLGSDGPEGLKSWRGSFSVDANNAHMLEPGEATLRLPDGRTGVVMVTEYRTSMRAGVKASGHLVGNGAPPSSPA